MEKQGIFYFSTHIFPILIFCGIFFDMPFLFAGIFFAILLLFTVLDFFVKRDSSYSHEEVLATYENDGRLAPWIYEAATTSFLFLHLISLIFVLYYVEFKESFLILFIYSYLLGFTGSNTLTICHEYFHHNTRREKFIGRFFLSLLFFNVYEYDHLYNHHDPEFACLDKDPSHAKLNESVYFFVRNYFLSTFRESIKLQRQFCKAEGTSFYNIFRNPLLRWGLFSVSIPFIIFFTLGWKALLCFMFQAYLSIFTYLSGAYNQHYGLTRRIKEDGTPEDFTYMNVWASDHYFTGRNYINVSHHGHHHLFNLCRYPYLKVIRLGPLLPYGYNAITLIAMFPKLWFKLMNPRVKEIFKLRDQYDKEGKL